MATMGWEIPIFRTIPELLIRFGLLGVWARNRLSVLRWVWRLRKRNR